MRAISKSDLLTKIRDFEEGEIEELELATDESLRQPPCLSNLPAAECRRFEPNWHCVPGPMALSCAVNSEPSEGTVWRPTGPRIHLVPRPLPQAITL